MAEHELLKELDFTAPAPALAQTPLISGLFGAAPQG